MADEEEEGAEDVDEEYKVLREIEEKHLGKKRKRGPYRKSWSGPA